MLSAAISRRKMAHRDPERDSRQRPLTRTRDLSRGGRPELPDIRSYPEAPETGTFISIWSPSRSIGRTRNCHQMTPGVRRQRGRLVPDRAHCATRRPGWEDDRARRHLPRRFVKLGPDKQVVEAGSKRPATRGLMTSPKHSPTRTAAPIFSPSITSPPRPLAPPTRRPAGRCHWRNWRCWSCAASVGT